MISFPVPLPERLTNKKAWELYLSLIPHFRPSHCPNPRISNEESPRRFVWRYKFLHGKAQEPYLYKTRRHLPLPCLLGLFKVAKFEVSKTRRSSKRLSIICLVSLHTLIIGVERKHHKDINFFFALLFCVRKSGGEELRLGIKINCHSIFLWMK